MVGGWKVGHTHEKTEMPLLLLHHLPRKPRSSSSSMQVTIATHQSHRLGQAGWSQAKKPLNVLTRRSRR